MKIKLLFGLLSILGAAQVSASQIDACNKNVSSEVCQDYLQGVVDGALMHRMDSSQKDIVPDSYAKRALKYRSGQRFKEANRMYCQGRIPDRESLVSGLGEAFITSEINDVTALKDVMLNLMDCNRNQ